MSATADVAAHAGQHAPDSRNARVDGRRERTRRKILEAAFGLIGHDKGLTVRIEEICAAARISRGTFYNYFTSLEQLFEVLAIEIGHELNAALVAAFDREFDSHAEGSNAAIQYYLVYARRNPEWAWAMVHLSAFGPTFGAEAWEACGEAIAAGIEKGEFDVPSATFGRDLMTGTVLASVRTMLRAEEEQAEPQAVAYHILRALGVAKERAQAITVLPLPEIVTPKQA